MKRPVPWYEWWPAQWGISADAFFLLVHLWNQRTWLQIQARMKLTDARNGLFELETKGWVRVKQSRNGRILAFELTDLAPAQPANLREDHVRD